MQAATSADAATEPILLQVERDGGHGQGKPLRLRIEEAADRWAFILPSPSYVPTRLAPGGWARVT